MRDGKRMMGKRFPVPLATNRRDTFQRKGFSLKAMNLHIFPVE